MKDEASVFFLKFASQAKAIQKCFPMRTFWIKPRAHIFKKIINFIKEFKGFKEDRKTDSIGLKRKNLRRINASAMLKKKHKTDMNDKENLGTENEIQ